MIGRIIWTTRIINFFLDIRATVIDLFIFLTKKLKKHISRSNIERIDFDPTFSHIKKVKEVLEKCLRKHKISKVLTAGFHTAIENLAIFLEKYCIKLTKNRPTKTNDSHHLVDIPEVINVRGIP